MRINLLAVLLCSFFVLRISSADEGNEKLVPPYDIWRRAPGRGLYSVGSYSVLAPTTDKPYVMRVMWGVGSEDGVAISGVSVVWSDGMVTNQLPKPEPVAPPLYANPPLDYVSPN